MYEMKFSGKISTGGDNVANKNSDQYQDRQKGKDQKGTQAKPNKDVNFDKNKPNQ